MVVGSVKAGQGVLASPCRRELATSCTSVEDILSLVAFACRLGMRCRAWPVGTKPQHSLGVATRVPRGHEIDNQVRSAVMGRWVRRRALGASPCWSWREVDHVASFLEFRFQG